MTDKEKAEEYVNKRPFIHLLGRNTFFIQKEFRDAILWGLAEGRNERNCVNCSNHGKQFEVMKLKKEIEQLKAQNEKLKSDYEQLLNEKIEVEDKLAESRECY